MIILNIHHTDPEQHKIAQKIQSMSLAHRVNISEQPVLPVMTAYDKEYVGLEAIATGILELEQLVEDWYECRCDKYKFDER
ncbi:MAG: hypothetical protein WBA23_01650 [Tunicatimonas sp.]|uniref:hypothetical protein n=1 Tax=Tunicatimonas sp. TaxID=1940096 RepID=UPI003C72BE8F